MTNKAIVLIALLGIVLILFESCSSANDQSLPEYSNLTSINAELDLPKNVYRALSQLKYGITHKEFGEIMTKNGGEKQNKDSASSVMDYSYSQTYIFDDHLEIVADFYHPNYPSASDEELFALVFDKKIELSGIVVKNVHLISADRKEYLLFSQDAVLNAPK